MACRLRSSFPDLDQPGTSETRTETLTTETPGARSMHRAFPLVRERKRRDPNPSNSCCRSSPATTAPVVSTPVTAGRLMNSSSVAPAPGTRWKSSANRRSDHCGGRDPHL